MDLPAPIETACEAPDQKSTFFHLLFSVTPKTPGNATADWKKLAEESLASYVRDHCAEGVLVQALHTDTLRLEVAIRFSGPGRDRNFVRDNLRKRTVLQSLPGSTQDWKVDSKVRGQAEDARLAVYESLRGRTMPQSPGGWRLVLDRAPRGERLPACSLIAGGSQAAAAAAPGPGWSRGWSQHVTAGHGRSRQDTAGHCGGWAVVAPRV